VTLIVEDYGTLSLSLSLVSPLSLASPLSSPSALCLRLDEMISYDMITFSLLSLPTILYLEFYLSELVKMYFCSCIFYMIFSALIIDDIYVAIWKSCRGWGNSWNQ